MAPQKTMAVGQQQQTSNRATQPPDQAAKSKKRKAKSSSSHQQQQQQQQPKADKQQVPTRANLQLGSSDTNENLTRKPSLDQIVASCQPGAKQQKDTILNTQVPSPKSAPNLSESKRDASIAEARAVLAKQISTEEQDDGIELDGSSNSESSVKDPNEDQVKSVSVSPIMAQSSLVNENRNGAKHAVENAPIEQLTGSLCTDITVSKKIGSTTKQQLAANQQVIDADEQSLQLKLQSKQRKSSVQSNTSSTRSLSGGNTGGQQAGVTPQSPSLCKVCDQHVYQMERMMAEKAIYHKSCFRCHQCKTQLRIDNYASHEGQVYCKAHHRQIFQPQVKLENDDDVDIVAKSRIRKRQMIICENEPAKLPEDVVRSDSKVDDGLGCLSLNLGNIKERFERGAASDESQPTSAGVVIEKPSFNLKKTLMAFETKSVNNSCDTEGDLKRDEKVVKPVVKKLANLNGIFERQASEESESSLTSPSIKPLAMRRSESLMMRLKKYESRIAGDQVVDEDSDDDENNNQATVNGRTGDVKSNDVPKKIASIDLSSLKNQWENGDISRRRFNFAEDPDDGSAGKTTGDNSPSTEKDEELTRVRQQLARKKSGGGSSSVKNIYENAIKEAQMQRTQASKLTTSDLSALNGYSRIEMQQQLLQNGSKNSQESSTPSTPNKDHFQLNMSKKANKLRERFEQGLISNGAYDDSDGSDGDGQPALSKLEQLRQEKLDDLDWLSSKHEGEIKAREARSMFQQIDRRLSNGQASPASPRTLSSVSASMQAKLQQKNSAKGPLADSAKVNLINGNDASSGKMSNHLKYEQQPASERSKPARFMTSFQ